MLQGCICKFMKLWGIMHPIHKSAGIPSPSPYKWGKRIRLEVNNTYELKVRAPKGRAKFVGCNFEIYFLLSQLFFCVRFLLFENVIHTPSANILHQTSIISTLKTLYCVLRLTRIWYHDKYVYAITWLYEYINSYIKRGSNKQYQMSITVWQYCI